MTNVGADFGLGKALREAREKAGFTLRMLAEKLDTKHGVSMNVLIHKPQRAPLTDTQANQLKGIDVAITGIGD